MRLHRYRQPPIMLANAKDAHCLGGNRLRCRYFEWRFQRQRLAFVRVADKGLKKCRSHVFNAFKAGLRSEAQWPLLGGY
jgi:hypothetical protein